MPNSYALAETENFPFRSGRGKKRFLVGKTFDIPVSGTYRRVGQLHNHRGCR